MLLFPCNQFSSQEPGTLPEIESFVQSKGATLSESFALFDKVNVNGSDALPLFVFLKKKARGFWGSKSIKWNFTKFLCDREGRPVRRFGPNEHPVTMTDDILKLL